jgi:spore coat protein CotH
MIFKGSYGTLYGCFENGELICERLSLKLKFSMLDEDLRFFGLKRLNLNANRHDDSRMKEKLAYDLYRAMDLPAPRASWAVLKVNGQSYGLYGMVEEIDGTFTKDRWPDYPDGNLYKEIWPTDTDPAFILAGLKTNEDVGDVSSFVEFGEAVSAAGAPDAVREVLARHTDLEHFARYMAVDEAILSLDGVTYFYTDDGLWFHNHNYYFYEDSPGRAAMAAWRDVGLGRVGTTAFKGAAWAGDA